MPRLIITIDGPAASGKSTIARFLAAKLNAAFLDTGAMYRAATLAAMKAKIDMTSQHQILEILNNTQFEFISSHHGMRVQIDGVDVTEEIRHPKVTANARFIAGLAAARKYLVSLQRSFAENHGRIITEGRDQGTVAFPDADVKFFLTAELGERTRRRQAELKSKGIEQGDEEISQLIEKRDQSDKNRSVGPLKIAENAINVDTTNLTVEQVVDKLLGYVKERCSGK
jgi:cytidylate kinase